MNSSFGGMETQDIRWEQRLINYSSALAQLAKAVVSAGQRPLSDLEKQGLIQAFEFTHELAWNVMPDAGAIVILTDTGLPESAIEKIRGILRDHPQICRVGVTFYPATKPSAQGER